MASLLTKFIYLFRKKWKEDGLKSWDENAKKKLSKDLEESIELIVKKPDVNVQDLRFLLVGEVGSGKSSLLNSFTSALAGKKARIAATGPSDDSFTIYCTEYTLKGRNQDSMRLPGKWCDCRGYVGINRKSYMKSLQKLLLERPQRNRKLPVEGGDRAAAKAGKDPREEESDAESDEENAATEAETTEWVPNKVCLIIITLDITQIIEDENGTIKSSGRWVEFLQDVKTLAIEHDIKFALFLTHCDSADRDLEDVSLLYYSPIIKKRLHQIADLLKIDTDRIYPVKNITSEVVVRPAMAIQFLLPLSQLLGDLVHQLDNY